MIELIITISALFSMHAFASVQTLVEEEKTATVSYLNDSRGMLKCSPGFDGGYITQDTLTLPGYAVSAAPQYANDEFIAHVPLEFVKGTTEGRAKKRPYEKGCKLALERLRAAVAGKEVIEVTVTRKVTSYVDTLPTAHRDAKGDVTSVEYPRYENIVEIQRFELAGIEFTLVKSMYGKQVK